MILCLASHVKTENAKNIHCFWSSVCVYLFVLELSMRSASAGADVLADDCHVIAFKNCQTAQQMPCFISQSICLAIKLFCGTFGGLLTKLTEIRMIRWLKRTLCRNNPEEAFGIAFRHFIKLNRIPPTGM